MSQSPTTDQVRTPQLTQDQLHAALGELMCNIEACGASEELTAAVMLADNIRAAVGNRFNRPSEFAAKRVLRDARVETCKECEGIGSGWDGSGGIEACPECTEKHKSRLPHEFHAEPHCCRGWNIYSGSQYICHCGSEDQRDLLLAGLNYWRGSFDEAITMARLLKDQIDSKRTQS